MAMRSEQNGRRRQLFCLQGHFAPRSKPFWRPEGFDPFCPFLRWQAQKYLHIPVACRLELGKMASNLESIFNESGPQA